MKQLNEKTRERAEAAFERKEQQATEGAKAWAEYLAANAAVLEKTARLKALRLASAKESDMAMRHTRGHAPISSK